MQGFLSNLANVFRQRKERSQNRLFLKASMASCAMVSISEGQVSFCDRIRLDQIMDTLDKLKAFDPHEGVDLFNYFIGRIAESPKQGREEALAAIQSVTADKETAELLIRLCLAISLSDGKTSLVEQIEIVTLCSLLGIEPKDFGLDMEEMPATVRADGLPPNAH